LTINIGWADIYFLTIGTCWWDIHFLTFGVGWANIHFLRIGMGWVEVHFLTIGKADALSTRLPCLLDKALSILDNRYGLDGSSFLDKYCG